MKSKVASDEFGRLTRNKYLEDVSRIRPQFTRKEGYNPNEEFGRITRNRHNR